MKKKKTCPHDIQNYTLQELIMGLGEGSKERLFSYFSYSKKLHQMTIFQLFFLVTNKCYSGSNESFLKLSLVVK